MNGKSFFEQNLCACFILYFCLNLLIMSIYVWKVGETALARLSKKVYAKVRVAKNEDGIFHDEKGTKVSIICLQS